MSGWHGAGRTLQEDRKYFIVTAMSCNSSVKSSSGVVKASHRRTSHAHVLHGQHHKRIARRQGQPCPPRRGLAVHAQQRPGNPDRGPADRPDTGADMFFEQSRWRWPAFREQGPRAPPPPPPPPPPQSGNQGGARSRTFRSSFRRAPPPPPSPGTLPTQLPPWAENLVSRDPELRDLLAEKPELWTDLQRRAGKAAGYVPPPGMPDPSVDPAAYEREVQRWLRYRRSQGGGGGQMAARQDDEIVSLALLYAAATLPILAFALAAAW
ncbi:hypothetical protein Vretimale_1379 [Volvox reticuliferus]|uniref:Uncharacterized protein n=1 Tax=Volvox reticuliferus TaxID=1737510 RepID=A0A8J4FY71_9CHLO|nr:hypothetical protein Vretifemale_10771 [Volvox reticuliferus]GIL95333.1 hypothetical protein Vretimale_1379 [Volvox reticuliferus]